MVSTQVLSIKKVYEEMTKVVVVRPAATGYSYEDISRHEKFRISMERNKKRKFAKATFFLVKFAKATFFQ